MGFRNDLNMSQDNNKTVYAAMSGGVDSSVAAALLKKQGFDVVGVFFRPWTPTLSATPPSSRLRRATSNRQPATSFCFWEQDRQDAMRVCAKFDIPFKTWDFSREYGKRVAQYMINGYRTGITPNPDVMCNKEIKFGLFLKKALAEGADYIATGHYVRIAQVKNYQVHKVRKAKHDKLDEHYKLLTGIDSNKDQSYFLWTLTQEQLKYCLFPIGGHTKPEVRKLAKKFGLPNHAKKDSQGVCFVGRLDMKEFLKNYIKPKTGDIVLVETGLPDGKAGKKIGQHDGVYYYTIGQRHGLDIKDGKGPYYVIGKDIRRNIIYVIDAPQKPNVKNQMSKIEKVNWVVNEPRFPINCQVKIRYRSKSMPAIITRSNLETGGLSIKFKKIVRALTPGQSAVFYRGQEVLGGGIIAEES